MPSLQEIEYQKLVSRQFLAELLALYVAAGLTEQAALDKMARLSDTELYTESIRLEQEVRL